jgi:pimeloyl-ACP methyl ester carboxylesterase
VTSRNPRFNLKRGVAPVTDAPADLKTVFWGDPDAENTTLLVHGLTGRADAFRALAEELEARGLTGWRLLVVDLRGRGASGRMEGKVGIPAHPRTSSRSWIERDSRKSPSSGILSGR